MAGIDDDLMDGLKNSFAQEKPHVTNNIEHASELPSPKRRGRGIRVVFQVIHSLLDAGMIVMSIYMMGLDVKEEPFRLVFCVGLIIWLAYRILFFPRSKSIDIITGIFLFVAVVFFYIVALSSYDIVGVICSYRKSVGRILIPNVYLGFFCVWGATRQNVNRIGDKNEK